MQVKNGYDVVVIGSGHNGLVAAAYLGLAGKSLLVLEKNDYLGGATTSQRVFPDYDAQLSRYAYLISLFPQQISEDLGLQFVTRQRSIASCTICHDANGNQKALLLSNTDAERSRASMRELTGGDRDWQGYQHLLSLQKSLAEIAWPSLLQPLRKRSWFLEQLKTPLQKEAWEFLVEKPLGQMIEKYIQHDAIRGLVTTDGKIGVFAHPHDESLIQNRCFLYHVIGNGTGQWQVPVGGMRKLVDALVDCCRKHRVEFLTSAQVVSLSAVPSQTAASKMEPVEVTFLSNEQQYQVSAKYVLINASPRVYHELLGNQWRPQADDEGSVVKINMLLKRLPKLTLPQISSRDAFTGSLHFDEGYQNMLKSYDAASRCEIPNPAPGEVYCHTLTDDSILSAELRRQGYHTLTLFGLDMPYRLFESEHNEIRAKVLESYLEGLDRFCTESFVDCLAVDRDGRPCVEIHSPQDLETELSLDLGNIFHNALSWFFVDDDALVGRRGVETEHPNVLLAGSSALRGGAVSGIPGYHAAQEILGRK